MFHGQRDTLKAIRSRSSNKKLVLMNEQVSELTIPWTGTYWSRQFGIINFPFLKARCEGIFSFVYHEYTTAIAGALVQGVKTVDNQLFVRTKALADATARGLILMPFITEVTDRSMSSVKAGYLSYTAAMQRYSNHFFKGTALVPPQVDSPSVTVHVGPNNFIEVGKVSTSRFIYNGEDRLFLVNAWDGHVEVTITWPHSSKTVSLLSHEVMSILLH